MTTLYGGPVCHAMNETILNRRQFCVAAVALAVAPAPIMAKPTPQVYEVWLGQDGSRHLYSANGDQITYLGPAANQ